MSIPWLPYAALLVGAIGCAVFALSRVERYRRQEPKQLAEESQRQSLHLSSTQSALALLVLASVFTITAYFKGLGSAVLPTVCVYVTGWFALNLRGKFIDFGFSTVEPARRTIPIVLALLSVVLMGAGMIGFAALAAKRFSQ